MTDVNILVALATIFVALQAILTATGVITAGFYIFNLFKKKSDDLVPLIFPRSPVGGLLPPVKDDKLPPTREDTQYL